MRNAYAVAVFILLVAYYENARSFQIQGKEYNKFQFRDGLFRWQKSINHRFGFRSRLRGGDSLSLVIPEDFPNMERALGFLESEQVEINLS